MKQIGIMDNGREKPQLSTGFLLVAKSKRIQRMEFKYSSERTDFNVTLGGIAIEHTLATKTIYTTRTDLPFAGGGKIELSDGNVMTIESVGKVEDKKKAYFNGDGLVGFNIVLEGGEA